MYYAAGEVEAQLCRDSDAVVIGGGNSAGQAATYLARQARRVHLLVRGQGLAASMSRYLADRVTCDPYLLETSVPGVFAAGDVRSGSIKRVASAVGEGAMAVTFAHGYLGGS